MSPQSERSPEVTIRGKVLLPDGRPAAGARVFAGDFHHRGEYESPVESNLLTVQGAPEAIARLLLRPMKPTLHVPSQGTTDADGRFAVRWARLLRVSTDRQVAVWAESGDLITSEVRLRPDEDTADAGTLRLGPALRPSLKLVDTEDAPVAGCYVDLDLSVRDRSGDARRDLHYSLGGRSDADGLVTLPPAPDRSDWRVSVRANHRDLPRHIDFDLPPSWLRDAPATLRMQRGCVVRGRVELPDGTPAAGARVSARNRRMDPDPSYGHSVVAAADGGFEIRGVPTSEGELTLVAPLLHRAPGETRTAAALKVAVQGREGEVVDVGTQRLLLLLTIAGQVLGPDGRPAPGGHARVDRAGTSSNLGHDGRFEITGLLPGVHTVRVSISEEPLKQVRGTPKELTAEVREVPAGTHDLVVHVTGGGNLIVRFHPVGRPDEPLSVHRPGLEWGHGSVGQGSQSTEIRHFFGPGLRDDLRVVAEGYEPRLLGPIEIRADRATILDVELQPDVCPPG